MMKVFTGQNLAEAQWVRGLLQAEGVPAEIRGEHLFGAIDAAARIIPGLLPSVWILDETQLYRAKAIVSRYLDGESAGKPIPGPPWICPGCGERIEPQFSECWQCGGAKPES